MQRNQEITTSNDVDNEAEMEAWKARQKKNAKQRASYKLNPEQAIARSKAYKKAHPDKVRAYNKAYNARKKEKNKAVHIPFNEEMKIEMCDAIFESMQKMEAVGYFNYHLDDDKQQNNLSNPQVMDLGFSSHQQFEDHTLVDPQHEEVVCRDFPSKNNFYYQNRFTGPQLFRDNRAPQNLVTTNTQHTHTEQTSISIPEENDDTFSNASFINNFIR